MMTHLSDEQMTDWLEGTAGEDSAQHLASCEECRSEAAGMQAAIAAYATVIRARAEKWPLQSIAAVREGSMERTEARRQWLPGRLSWVASFALLALAAILLMTAPSPRLPATQQDADDALLLDIQQQLERDVPEALAPAALLTAERNRIIAATVNGRRSR